ncbi:uncharacterized protein L201_007564 [Kwoniella dendrophila CBS 6074]|uniref:Uncharacterized protein n=1 Tax=Kwoniella dendrophila CBS 6074 TaxID=1295534 RepID=A0AAX4K4S4_9TREE
MVLNKPLHIILLGGTITLILISLWTYPSSSSWSTTTTTIFSSSIQDFSSQQTIKGDSINLQNIFEDINLSLNLPSNEEGIQNSDDDEIEVDNFRIIGQRVSQIKLDDSKIIDYQTGSIIQGVNEGSSFNSAVLKLPKGSKWGFLGVARGPTRQRDFMKVNGHSSREQVLIAMGLNITSQGHLFPVTQGQTLDFQMIPREGCAISHSWIATYGAEDPRLFWTDAGTPALTYARAALDKDKCRSIGFVEDLRSIFPDLHDALKTGVEGVVPYDGYKRPGQGVDLELYWAKNQGAIEKNWMPFYPGSLPDGKTIIPNIHYKVKSAVSLEPIGETYNRAIYQQLELDTTLKSNTKQCIGNKHLNSFKIHQATPLYRLTLCSRSDFYEGNGKCLITNENTINIALSHTQSLTRQYGRFISTFNITYPFNPISVGPRFKLNGCDENHINYALSLVPVSKSDLNPNEESSRAKKAKQIVQPDHFFLDDNVLITMGQDDIEMTSVLATVRELLGDQEMC